MYVLHARHIKVRSWENKGTVLNLGSPRPMHAISVRSGARPFPLSRDAGHAHRSGQDGASRGGIRPKGERRGARPDSCRPRPAKDSQGIGRQGFVGLGGLRLAFGRGKSIAFVGPSRRPGRRTHNAAQMSAAGTRTVPIYSQSVPVDVPTRKILSDHGLDDPCPSVFKLRFQVYKKVAVSAALVTAEVEEAYVLSAHVALALLRDIPRLQCYGTNHYIDLDKTLAFHTPKTPEEKKAAYKAKKERQAARKAAREAVEKAGEDTADEAE